jgi:hypothetical protein
LKAVLVLPHLLFLLVALQTSTFSAAFFFLSLPLPPTASRGRSRKGGPVGEFGLEGKEGRLALWANQAPNTLLKEEAEKEAEVKSKGDFQLMSV